MNLPNLTCKLWVNLPSKFLRVLYKEAPDTSDDVNMLPETRKQSKIYTKIARKLQFKKYVIFFSANDYANTVMKNSLLLC